MSHAAVPLPILPSPPADRDPSACAGCGAPLDASARYCLNCGTRRAGAPPAFLDVVDQAPAVVPPPVTLPQPPAPRTWPLALAVVVLLALLVGLLAGHWLGERDRGGDGRGTATQVIGVAGQGASVAVPATTGATP